ncbi:MAG TPA: DUF1801 domain-containing protein [Roseiflexaceae bacterium]|nr:DUF1801 domain-containing protein [Roseiflexaceae bacterium]
MGAATLSYEDYLAAVPPERRAEIARVWELVRAHVPDGYSEEITPKFLTFKAGAEWYVALANQKNYLSIYLMPIYVFPELKALLDSSGKKLKMGKSCINFKRADELPLEQIAAVLATNQADAYVAQIERIRREHSRSKA